MKKRKVIIAFIASLVFSVLFALLYKWRQTGDPFQSETLVYGAIIFVNIVILGGIGYGILSRFIGQSASQTKRQIIPAFLIFVLVALVISLSLVSLGVYLFFLIKGFSTSNFITHLFTVELKSAFRQFSVWILLASAFFFYIIWRKTLEREQKLREENLKHKYRSLKSQVNPHFLFNSLNTLSEIVYVDAKKADNYIQKLSGIYRYILENEETDFVPLNEELEFVKQYFALQKERDNDKISLEIEIQNAEGYKIIPVSLQLLVENALKHNSMSYEKPLDIHISHGNEYVIVSNNIQRKNILESSTHTGLSNLKDRVKLIMGKEIIISEENNKFTVKLPIIRA